MMKCRVLITTAHIVDLEQSKAGASMKNSHGMTFGEYVLKLLDQRKQVTLGYVDPGGEEEAEVVFSDAMFTGLRKEACSVYHDTGGFPNRGCGDEVWRGRSTVEPEEE